MVLQIIWGSVCEEFVVLCIPVSVYMTFATEAKCLKLEYPTHLVGVTSKLIFLPISSVCLGGDFFPSFCFCCVEVGDTSGKSALEKVSLGGLFLVRLLLCEAGRLPSWAWLMSALIRCSSSVDSKRDKFNFELFLNKSFNKESSSTSPNKKGLQWSLIPNSR